MENDQLNKEWERLGQELDQEMSDLPTVELSEKHQSIYQKRLVSNNMVELILGIFQIPLLAIMILTMDEYGQLPIWIQLCLWSTAIIHVIPSLRLYRSIHFADPSTPTVHYLKKLVKRMDQFKVFQVTAAFFLTFIIVQSVFLVTDGFTLSIEGETYRSIINFPPEHQMKYLLITSGITFVVSLIGSGSGYMMYWIFYKRRRNETMERLKMFE